MCINNYFLNDPIHFICASQCDRSISIYVVAEPFSDINIARSPVACCIALFSAVLVAIHVGGVFFFFFCWSHRLYWSLYIYIVGRNMFVWKYVWKDRVLGKWEKFLKCVASLNRSAESLLHATSWALSSYWRHILIDGKVFFLLLVSSIGFILKKLIMVLIVQTFYPHDSLTLKASWSYNLVNSNFLPFK